MGEIDWRQELGAPAPTAPGTGPPPESVERDWGRELGAHTPHSPAMHERVQAKAHAIMQWLPGGEALQALPALPARAQLPVKELAPPLMPEMIGAVQTPGILPMVGELTGGIAGSSVMPGPGTVTGAAIGAGTGQALEDYILHGEIDPQRAGMEAALSIVPEVAESAVRGLARGLLRVTPGGKLLRFEEAARRARQMPGIVFEPAERGRVSAMFERVRQSGVKIDLTDIRSSIQGMPQGKYDDLYAEAARIDRRLKTGGRYARLLGNLRAAGTSPAIVGWDVGDLQTLRSEVRKRKNELAPVEARQLLDDFQYDIDEAIDTGLTRGGRAAGDTPELLRDARREWARLRSAEDMAGMIEEAITSTPDISMATFNLRQFFDGLRRNRTRMAQQVNRALDIAPGARDRYYREVSDISNLYRSIELPLTDVAGFRRFALIGGLGQMLSTIMLSDTGRRLLRDAVVHGRGRVSPNIIALIANQVRREALRPDLEPLQLEAVEP